MTSCGVGLLVMFDGSKAQGQNVWGDLMALAAAMFMGAYSVQLKHMLGGPQSKNISMPMFFGFLGVTAVVISIPIFLAVVLLHVTGWAHLGLIHQLNADTMGALTVNGLVGTVLSDVLWAEAVLLTSPLAVNLSICLTIPLAFLVDHLRGVVVAPPQPLYILGAVPVTFTSCMQDCMRRTHWHSRSVV
jgi:drug/metabolite transporter (DMT)-like permease